MGAEFERVCEVTHGEWICDISGTCVALPGWLCNINAACSPRPAVDVRQRVVSFPQQQMPLSAFGNIFIAGWNGTLVQATALHVCLSIRNIRHNGKKRPRESCSGKSSRRTQIAMKCRLSNFRMKDLSKDLSSRGKRHYHGTSQSTGGSPWHENDCSLSQLCLC